MPIAEGVREKVRAGERVSREEAVGLLREGDFLELGMLADAVRWRKHPEPVVTYIIDRNINYTNVCTAQCAFCAFYRDLPSPEGYLLGKQELSRKIEETLALGGRQILLQGGLHPDLPWSYFVDMMKGIKRARPDIHVKAFTAVEIFFFHRLYRMQIERVLAELKEAGLDSLSVDLSAADAAFPGAVDACTDTLQHVAVAGQLALEVQHGNRVPGYVDVALRRWMALTGEEAVLATTGEPFTEVA